MTPTDGSSRTSTVRPFGRTRRVTSNGAASPGAATAQQDQRQGQASHREGGKSATRT